jgi:hypothetical protein
VAGGLSGGAGVSHRPARKIDGSLFGNPGMRYHLPVLVGRGRCSSSVLP